MNKLRARRTKRRADADVLVVIAAKWRDAELRAAEYADALSTMLDWLDRGAMEEHLVQFTADKMHARALLSRRERTNP